MTRETARSEEFRRATAGVLRSMSEANCFIVLPLEQGDVEAGAEVDVQPFAGLV